MGTAIVGLLGVVVGVLLGGGVQLLVARQERKAQSKRAARLLFLDSQLCLQAVELLQGGDRRWYPPTTPALDGWRKHREALAGAMEGRSFQTVDSAFSAVARLDAFIEYNDDLQDFELSAEDAAQQLREASKFLLAEGFSDEERQRIERA